MTKPNDNSQADQPLGLPLNDGLGAAEPTRDVATNNPSGRKCNECGAVFDGEPEHSICGACAAAYEEAMQQEERRAQWHAEMRRDAFGA